MTDQTQSHELVIVFGRYPVPGQTKTRLIPSLGSAGAAELQRELTEKVLRTLQDSSVPISLDRVFCYEGGERKQIDRWLNTSLQMWPQGVGDLGQRMRSAILYAFEQGYQRVVLMGTDVWGFQGKHLLLAFEAFEAHEVVLGPSHDGGYWLIGLSSFHEIFWDIDWGTEWVLAQTMSRISRLGLNVCQLDPLPDIDECEDVTRWIPEWPSSNPYLSVIIPALNEEKYIASTILRAQDDDAEILVVDGGSQDETANLAAECGARVFHSVQGRAWQQNYGASLARGKVFLFVHADTLLPENYIAHIFEALLDHRTVLGAFRFKTDNKLSGMRLIEWMTNVRSKYLKLPYGDQCLFLRRLDFFQAGGFPHTPVAEDLFFVRKLGRYGRFSLAPVAAVTSSRRWERSGIVKTTFFNQLILLACSLRLPTRVLSFLYRKL